MSSLNLRRRTLNARERAKAVLPRTLYVNRPLLNADAFESWAKTNGFRTVVVDPHVTIAYSKTPLVWPRPDAGSLQVKAGGSRTLEQLGDEGAVVLRFSSDDLQRRWREFRDAGASWDWDSYQPHVTITYDGGDVDLEQVEPFDGPLEFGPEEFAEIAEDGPDIKEKWDESQHPRVPAGSPEGGQFGEGDGNVNGGVVSEEDGIAIVNKFPKAGSVDGLEVIDDVPNMSSIASSLGSDYTVIKEFRVVSFSAFSGAGNPVRDERTKKLAVAIKNSGQIKPLIVVIEDRDLAAGPYILEGLHRFDALQILGKKSFPALVVVDHSPDMKSLRGGPNIRRRTLNARERAEALLREWDESKHPRVPAGSPDGGEFGSGSGGGKTEYKIDGDAHPDFKKIIASSIGKLPKALMKAAGNPKVFAVKADKLIGAFAYFNRGKRGKITYIQNSLGRTKDRQFVDIVVAHEILHALDDRYDISHSLPFFSAQLDDREFYPSKKRFPHKKGTFEDDIGSTLRFASGSYYEAFAEIASRMLIAPTARNSQTLFKYFPRTTEFVRKELLKRKLI